MRGLACQTCRLTSRKTKAESSKGLFPKCPRGQVLVLGWESRAPGFLLLCSLLPVYMCACLLFLFTNPYDMHTDGNPGLWGPNKSDFQSQPSLPYSVTSGGLFNACGLITVANPLRFQGFHETMIEKA